MRTTNAEATAKEVQIIENCAEVLRALGENIRVTVRQDRHQENDEELILRGSWGTATFQAEVKTRLTTQNIKPIVALLRSNRSVNAKRLLMSDHINPKVGIILRKEGIDFVDAAGNVSLNTPHLLVWQYGFKPIAKPERATRLFQVAGLKLLSILLWTPDAAGAQYREVAKRAGISLGATVPIFEELTKGGFLRVNKAGERKLIRKKELMDRWIVGYSGQLFPRLAIKTCRLAGDDSVHTLHEVIRQNFLREKVLIGGELAAAIATGYLRPARAALHIPAGNRAKLMGLLRLIPDPAGNVDLIEQFGTDNQWLTPPTSVPNISVVNPLLIYGELLRAGPDDRLRETANLIRTNFLEPMIQEKI